MLDNPSLSLSAVVARLAALSPLAYEQQRVAEATALKVRVSVLDAEVALVREALVPKDDSDIADEDNEAVRAAVAEFNRRFYMVNDAGRAIVLQPGYDLALRRRYHDRLTTRDLQTLYMNERIQTGIDDKGRPVHRSVADVWLRHHDRRQFINGVTFDPSSTRERPGVLNLWEGYAVEPAPGDWSLMKAHIGQVICDGNALRMDYLLKWMARMFQHPDQRGEVAVVLKGVEGSGKGTLANALLKICGQHGLAINTPKHLVGNFNGHLRDAIFIFADEAFFAGDKASVGTLKSLITEPYLTVEAKFQNAVQQPNFLHVLMASNNEWVVPASLEARRFFVLEVPDSRVKDHAYFGKIQAQMDAGGYEAMLHELLQLDLAGFNVRDVPNTEGLQRQRSLSLPVPEAWWKDCLERGYVFRSKLGLEEHFGHWEEKVSTELLFASYMEFATARHERHPMSRETLGRLLVRMGCESRRFKDHPVGEHITDVPNPFGGTQRAARVVIHPRPMGYSLGTLTRARDEFIGETGLSVGWGEREDNEV